MSSKHGLNDDDYDVLMRAAKVCGITLTYSNNYGDWSSGTPYSRNDQPWNPLIDERLAFRLMISHKIVIHADIMMRGISGVMREIVTQIANKQACTIK